MQVNIGEDPLIDEITRIADETGGAMISKPTPKAAADAAVDAIEHAPAPPAAWAGGPYVTTLSTVVELDGSDSSDPNGDIVRYEWDLDGDGTFDTRSSKPITRHVFRQPFDGSVTLRVTDSTGRWSTATARAHASLDGDEASAEADNCPDISNHSQSDLDRDGVGDACDPEPFTPTRG